LSKNYLSVISQALHYVSFSCKKPATRFDKAALIFSIDVDVGSQRLGEKNGGKNNHNVHDYLSESVIGRVEEQAVPLLLQAFNDLGVPVTFALRGQLAEVENSIIALILRSPVKHDIGAHGYYHRTFTTLSRVEAEKELEMISEGMKKFGIKPRSFVFPKNRVAHLSLLEKWGYLCFRAYGDLLRDGMFVKKCRNLYDVHPGLYLGKCSNPIFLNKIINIAVKYRAPLHVWFHPWDFGNSPKAVNMKIVKVLQPFLKHAKQEQDNDTLEFETMRSIAEKTARARWQQCGNPLGF
jgi:peptidoglycan/xylan/chitin deacetylase (PgdA/CDA1 family)